MCQAGEAGLCRQHACALRQKADAMFAVAFEGYAIYGNVGSHVASHRPVAINATASAILASGRSPNTAELGRDTAPNALVIVFGRRLRSAGASMAQPKKGTPCRRAACGCAVTRRRVERRLSALQTGSKPGCVVTALRQRPPSTLNKVSRLTCSLKRKSTKACCAVYNKRCASSTAMAVSTPAC